MTRLAAIDSIDWTCKVGTSKMPPLKFFVKQKKTPLPDPSGALSREEPSSAIASANEVQKITSLSASQSQFTHHLHMT